MENLLKKLQEEANLSEEQSIKVMSIVKEFMDKEGLDVDWDKFVKVKYDDLKDQAKSLFDTLSHKAKEYSDIIEDRVEDLTIQAKRTARDLSQKASDYLDDEKKK